MQSIWNDNMIGCHYLNVDTFDGEKIVEYATEYFDNFFAMSKRQADLDSQLGHLNPKFETGFKTVTAMMLEAPELFGEW